MKNIKRTATRFGFIAAMVFALVATVMPVAAVNGPIGASGVATGSLTGSAGGSFNFAVTLSGVNQTGIATVGNTSFANAIDSTNTNGFNISLSATSFVSTAAPADSLGTIVFTGGTTTTVGGGSVLAAGTALAAGALKVFTIANGNETSNSTSNGLNPTFTLSVPANTIAHTDYNSTLTASFVQGP